MNESNSYNLILEGRNDAFNVKMELNNASSVGRLRRVSTAAAAGMAAGIATCDVATPLPLLTASPFHCTTSGSRLTINACAMYNVS